MPQEKIVLVVPAFNEEAHIQHCVEYCLSLLKIGVAHDFVVVDDGSTDGTAQLAKQAGAKVISLNENAGKGGAFLQGALYCKRNGADVLVMIDADFFGVEGKPISAMLGLLHANDGSPSPCLMVVAPASEGRLPPSHTLSGERAIRMKALAFLFVESGGGFSFSQSKPAVRFTKMARRFGLEEALDWQVRCSARLKASKGQFRLDCAFRKGRDGQWKDIAETRELIKEREEKWAVLGRNIRRPGPEVARPKLFGFAMLRKLFRPIAIKNSATKPPHGMPA